MKKLLISLSISFISITGFSQDVYIPDANFKAYLVGNSEINKNQDTEISVAEAEAFSGTINCSSKNIADLTGIESFVYLFGLDCSNNSLFSLDVTGFSNLFYLQCSNNNLSSLYISGLSNLTSLSCGNNNLSSLDVSELSNLTSLSCFNNHSLSTICVAVTHDTSNWQKDDSTQWSTTCDPLAFSETQSIEKAQVIKAYNLQGQEVPLDTKGEVIILLYDNGIREKTYVAQ